MQTSFRLRRRVFLFLRLLSRSPPLPFILPKDDFDESHVSSSRFSSSGEAAKLLSLKMAPSPITYRSGGGGLPSDSFSPFSPAWIDPPLLTCRRLRSLRHFSWSSSEGRCCSSLRWRPPFFFLPLSIRALFSAIIFFHFSQSTLSFQNLNYAYLVEWWNKSFRRLLPPLQRRTAVFPYRIGRAYVLYQISVPQIERYSVPLLSALIGRSSPFG